MKITIIERVESQNPDDLEENEDVYLHELKSLRAVVTKVRRSGIDIKPHPSLTLMFGDKLYVVAPEKYGERMFYRGDFNYGINPRKAWKNRKHCFSAFTKFRESYDWNIFNYISTFFNLL
ncbi:hypothetical protein [Lebetimonas sp. JH292]|uniref:hypothetical protein n=1 Tax=Lebetimonas sp. JH292 TaxID=990068 RepID=UPI0004634B60|nr:hypothetical protein [Lebetimonas sp. JH292]